MRLETEENQISSVIRRKSVRRLLLVLPIVAFVGGCEGEAGTKAEVIRPVKVAVVEAGSGARTLTYSGVVRPRIESAVGFRVAGKIVERAVNVGDRIAVGQVIARLDETDLTLAENSAKAAVASARSRRDVARDNLERAKTLLPKAIISQAAYDTRSNELNAAEAGLESAEAQLRQAANAVGYATLKADKAGIVTGVTGEPGQVVSAGQAVITLADAGETEIAIAVPETDAGRLAAGQSAKVTLWAGPQVSTPGRVREIGGQADAASRTYAVRVAVDGPPKGMRLGMTAAVTMRLDEEAAPAVVPVSALAEDNGNPVVFIIDPVGKSVRKTPVEIARVTTDGVQVAAGLQSGDIVVTAGVQFLRDGMRVRLPGEGPVARAGKPI